MDGHPKGRRRRRRIRIPVPSIPGRSGRHDDDPPPLWYDDGPPEGGVREPRRPRPSLPSAAAALPEPEPQIVAADHTEPPAVATLP